MFRYGQGRRCEQGYSRLINAKSKTDFVDGLAKIFTAASQDVFVEELLAWAEGKETFESEIDNLTLNGELKQVKIICNVVPGYENSLARVLVSIVDLTQQKEMREIIEITAFGRYWTDCYDGRS